MHFAQFAKRLIMLAVLLLTCLTAFIPAAALAQSTEGITVSADRIEAWMGREKTVNHPAIPNLKERESATLKFYYEVAYERRALDIIKTAPSARLKNMLFLPEETVSNVNIYLLGDLNTYFTAQDAPGRAPDWAAGLSLLADDVILIRLKSVGNAKIEPERTLAHELNHVALRRLAGDAYFPHWFYEGIAMLSTGDWDYNRADTLAKAAMTGHLLDLNEIDSAFGKQGAVVNLAYSQSAHFVSWLDKTYGSKKIENLIKNVADGKPFNEAFFDNFERSPNAAFALWKESQSKSQSVLASFFSHDALFFYTAIFAALALIIALIRKSKNKKARLNNMTAELPISALPENLRNFGPFSNKPSK